MIAGLLALVAAAGPVAAPVTAPVAAPVIGATVFVATPTATLRLAPADEAARLAELPIWTAVRVERLEARGGAAARVTWAHVVVGPRTLLYDTIAGEARPVAPSAAGFPSSARRGWLRAEDLDPAPPPRSVLVSRATGMARGAERDGLLARARALDPFDDVVADEPARDPPSPVPSSTTTAADSPFARADLVFGCRGDLTRAPVVGGSVAGLGAPRSPSLPADVCIGHLDVRPPCPPPEEDLGDEATEEGAEHRDGARDGDRDGARHEDAAAVAHKVALARVVPRFGRHGPALRLVLAPRADGAEGLPAPVFVATRLLAADGCSGCTDTVAVTDVRVERLRVPLPGAFPTLLHVVVPRYTGVIYDVVAAAGPDELDADGAASFELGEAFDADPREEPGPGEHLFMAPAGCRCPCDE